MLLIDFKLFVFSLLHDRSLRQILNLITCDASGGETRYLSVGPGRAALWRIELARQTRIESSVFYSSGNWDSRPTGGRREQPMGPRDGGRKL